MANQVSIQFNSHNAAFEDNPEEAANIVNKLAEVIRQRGTGLHSMYETNIKDSYGNTIGKLTVNRS